MRVPEALDALRLECALVSEHTLQLSEERFGLPTRCPPWTVKDLLAHIHRDVESIILAVAREVDQDPDTDSISYWDYDPVAEGKTIADRALARAASYRRGVDLAIVWDDLWRHALDLAEREPPLRRVVTWGPIMTLDEYLKTRSLEVTVHGMDMAAALRVDPWTTQEGADVTTEILRGLLGEERVPELGWGDLTFIDKGTGREPLTDAERRILGSKADRFPLLA